jgi:hypothetical protein
MEADRLKGWTPARVKWSGGRPVIDWCYTGDRRFTEPFFENTLQHCLRRPFALLFRHETPIETLRDLHAARPGLAPTGFLFHMSRCGSTLASQMLAALPQNLVLSEPGPVDAILRTRLRDGAPPDEERSAWLRWMVSALGQPRTGQEKHLFIKFDCWNVLELPVIRRTFPEVPWVFLYRNPLEVLVSQMRQRGVQMIPGMLEPALFGVDPAAALAMPPEEYCARVLACMCGAALKHGQGDPLGLWLNYRDLPAAVCSTLLDHFGVQFAPADLERMRQVTQFDAKNPSMFFTDDTAAKERAASERVRRLADEMLRSLYRELEACRSAKGPAV